MQKPTLWQIFASRYWIKTNVLTKYVQNISAPFTQVLSRLKRGMVDSGNARSTKLQIE